MPIRPLRDRRDLCRTLRVLADRQREALVAEDYDALLAVLAEKQRLLDRLPAANAAARDWSTARAGVAEPDRSEGDALAAEGGRLLAELLRIEEESVADLTARRDATRDELRDLNAAGRVHSAYRDALAPVTHRSLDVDL